MAFKIIKNPIFTATAKIVIPGDDAPLEQTVGVRFRYGEWVEGLTDVQFLSNIVIDMFDLTDEAGNAVKFADVRDDLFAMPFVRGGLAKAYFEALAGAAAKN